MPLDGNETTEVTTADEKQDSKTAVQLIPELPGVDFNHERIELPRDNTGLIRCIFKIPFSELGVTGFRNFNMLLKHPLDDLKYSRELFTEDTLVTRKRDMRRKRD